MNTEQLFRQPTNTANPTRNRILRMWKKHAAYSIYKLSKSKS